MSFNQTELKNGLEVVGEPNPDAKSVALGFLVRTGARDETAEVAGVSHFLEHMVFKGTETRSAARVNLEFDEIGANYNASTSDEVTVYYGAVLPEQQARLLALFGDLMRPSLRQDDFDTEKNVILEEIAMYDDRPEFTLYDKTQERYFGTHPLANSVLGTRESIATLERDRMLEYFQRRYAPNNIKLVLAGNYDWDAAVKQAEAITRDWVRADTPRDLSPPQPTTQTHVEQTDKFNRAHLCWAMPGWSEQDPKSRVADLAAYALGAAKGSRLFWALKEPGIADSVGFDHSSKDGAGAFFGYASCDPERTQEVADLLRATVREACRNGLTEAEVNGARRKMAAGRTLRAETPLGRLMTVGGDWLYRREIEPLDDAIDRLLAITAAEVNALLGEIDLDRGAFVGLGPIDSLVAN